MLAKSCARRRLPWSTTAGDFISRRVQTIFFPIPSPSCVTPCPGMPQSFPTDGPMRGASRNPVATIRPAWGVNWGGSGSRRYRKRPVCAIRLSLSNSGCLHGFAMIPVVLKHPSPPPPPSRLLFSSPAGVVHGSMFWPSQGSHARRFGLGAGPIRAFFCGSQGVAAALGAR